MTVRDLMNEMHLKLLTPEASGQGEVTSGYTCDLLSWVMAHGQQGMAWVTVQTHMNVVAVALLLEMGCVILPEGIQPEEAMLAKATEEGLPILSSEETAFALCAKMAALGIPAAKRT